MWLVRVEGTNPFRQIENWSVLAAELCVAVQHGRAWQQQAASTATNLQHLQHPPPSSNRHPTFSDLSIRLTTNPFKMLIPKADRKKIHEYLFREGVMVAKKDYNLPKHQELDVKNLFVIKACQSLTSRGYLKTQFSWQYYYYTLTPTGLEYLREWLHLPSEIVPATHVKQQRSTAPPRGMMGGDERRERRGGDRGDREGYRRRDKEGGAPGEFKPEFRGGFGRGRGGAPPAATQ
ncbi:hypothetical protein H072_934 [Dactylellina haptotyla CBS 200.50]|uniref:Plectin/eS10 N-terminal domain-containing protein n=1 Tax=Dactylellina haptotyla (strain CBS 200.50) TaxID=1284197 RepID=S8BZW0_DACHA|nr:hypothetical protein H072_934 [Dactylellina haptotyla CBS 200.50]